jgi:REP element-mobilizing transposase RayT
LNAALRSKRSKQKCEAKERFGLGVLDYVVTSNHMHLLVKDIGSNIIAQSMQLKAGRTAQEYCDRLRAYVVFA